MQKKSYACEIVDMMNLIYQNNLTTVSGGNLSLKLEDGTIWISPSGVDKGALKEDDIVCLKADGTKIGKNPASIELPFHQQIYEVSPKVKAIIHVHAPNLIATSILRKVPDINVLPQCSEIIGRVGIAPYDVPGGAALGKKIADVFAKGYDSVILENHGIVIGADTMQHAYYRLEAINMMFEIEARSKVLGENTHLKNADPKLWASFTNTPSSKTMQQNTALTAELHQYVKRIYSKGFSLANPNMFCASVREKDGMIVNPSDIAMYEISEKDYCFVTAETVCNHHQMVHMEIYKTHPEINCIITTLAANILCFATTGTHFQTKIIPESYVVLQNVKELPGEAYGDINKIKSVLTPSTNEIIFANSCVLCCGNTPLKMFDRIEVLEYSAKAVIDAQNVGDIVYIEGDAIKDIIKAFNLPE